MNCTSCKYGKLIEHIRRRCLACNPDSDGGTPHGRVKADEFTLNAVPKAVDFDRTPSVRATNLKPSDEHKLRLAMSSLFGLDPVDLLLVQHLVQGQTLESFVPKLKGIIEQVRAYRSARQMAWERKEKILHQMPTLASVVKTTRENDTASRIERELEDAKREHFQNRVKHA